MNFESALKLMREGKSVRNGPCKCGFILDVCPNSSQILDFLGDSVEFDSNLIMSEEWEIVK
jgi:hypothetical protein